MNFSPFVHDLEPGEQLVWQGRPAPRCYTFRHWLQATIGTLLFFACSFWLMVGVQLVKASNYSWWLVTVPLLLVIASFFVGPGQLIIARWRWEKIFYALTDRRLLVRNQLFGARTMEYRLTDFLKFGRKQYGDRLFSLRLSFRNHAPVVLECLEHPELFLAHLPDSDGVHAPADSV